MSKLYEQAIALDAKDELNHLRDAFELPEDTIYLDGNSLGALPKSVKPHISRVVEQQWGQDLISSWTKHAWIDLAQSVGGKIAPLLGVDREQVIVADSISVNLFKLLSIALKNNSGRSTVLSTDNNFPTDLYVAQGLEGLLGEHHCKLKTVRPDQIDDHLNDDVAVLMLTQVDFRSGKIFDIEKLTEAAHQVGALVIWDLAHSTGVLPLQLNEWNVDFSVGCGYKFLNGGPGAPAFVSVGKGFLSHLSQPIQGWMGHAQPFSFDTQYAGAKNAKQLLTGTPAVLSLAALDAALDVYKDVEQQSLREKSLSLSRLFIEAFDHTLDQEPDNMSGFSICDRLADEQRGSHVSLAHANGYAISQALIDQKVIVDFRAPNLIRFGFSPLYNSHLDVVKSVECLLDVMKNQLYTHAKYQTKKSVT